MKKTVRISAVILSLVMILCALAPAAYAAQKKVIIFVDGIGAEDILDAETGETLFPPAASKIIKGVVPNIGTIINGIKTDDYSALEPSLVEVVNDLFTPIACDTSTGLPSDKTKFDYEWPEEEQIRDYYESDAKNARIRYCFDWRLSMQDIADGLHDFIEYVRDTLEVDKVALIGFSMGTCAVMSYLYKYDYQYVDSVVLLAGGYNGSGNCGQPFSGKIKLDADALVRFVDGMMGTDNMGGALVSALLHLINADGFLDKAIGKGTDMVDQLSDAVYSQVFNKTFATLPGLWSLVPLEDYENAKKVIGDSLPAEFIEMIDWYHVNVQANNKKIIDGCFDRGINFGIIAKYGFPNTPCIEDINSMSDSVINTTYEAFGATCADVDKTLGADYVQAVDNGHNCISPDNMIDSSTGEYCDYTWFVKNSAHASDLTAMMILSRYIIESDTQVTVWDGEYPQYLTVVNDEPVPLTAENDMSVYKADMSGENAFSVIRDFISNFFKIVKNSITSAFGRLTSFKVC